MDRSASKWQVPPPSGHFLRLVRRLQLVEGGKEPTARICALLDLSQLPAGWSKRVKGASAVAVAPILVHMRMLLQDALSRSGVEIVSFRAICGCFQLVVAPASLARAREIVARHANWVGAGPAFLREADPAWKSYAESSLRQFAEACAMEKAPVTKVKTTQPTAARPKITLRQVKTAVTELRAAGEHTVKALRLPDPKNATRPYPRIAPADPASPERIAALEKQLGVKLPASYRHFLSLHDGWREFDLGSDLLGANALATFHTTQAPKVLPRIVGELGRKTAQGLLVIATSGKTPMFLFDTAKGGKDGEWPVLEYDKEEGLLAEYDNFLEALKDTADTVREVARGTVLQIPKPRKGQGD